MVCFHLVLLVSVGLRREFTDTDRVDVHPGIQAEAPQRRSETRAHVGARGRDEA